MGVEVLTVEKMAAGGDAIGRLADGRIVFVEGALPGETVRVQVHTMKRDFARAAIEEVVYASPSRVRPPCPEWHRGCGGCSWQHIAPSAQLELKVAVVREALARTARLTDVDVRPGGSVGPWAYRTTVRLAAAGGGRVGLRERASHRVVPLDECLVAHPAITETLPSLRLSGADEMSLRVSAATGEMTAWSPDPGSTIDGLPPHATVGARAVLHEDVAGVRLRVSAGSFFQSGPDAAGLLVEAVRVACGPIAPDATMLDAYGGVGLFAATLTAGPVVLVESSELACADAALNLGARAVVECVPFERWTPRHVDVAVADPARAGLARGGVTALVATGSAHIVLVSCDPVAMARDAALLCAAGYRHAGSTVLDLFPNTPHVEVVTRFERVTGDA